MTEERKIKAALKVDAGQIQLPPDLLDRIRRRADTVTPVCPSLWARWRLGPKLELALACILLVSLLGMAAYRNLNSGRSQQSPTSPDSRGALSADNADESLALLRKEAPFPIFVPTQIPAGLEPRPPITRDRVVEIVYLTNDLKVELRVINGPAGCCLDADSRKAVGATSIRGDITAYYIINQPEFGGPILWWQEAGSYIALSGPSFAKDDLVKIAASMSSTATLTSQ
ncbi:MAG: hypothetical protein ACOY94_08580 [Bacillota bacterium]